MLMSALPLGKESIAFTIAAAKSLRQSGGRPAWDLGWTAPDMQLDPASHEWDYLQGI
jgi:hypothetical protein